jgi:hypothetical protein
VNGPEPSRPGSFTPSVRSQDGRLRLDEIFVCSPSSAQLFVQIHAPARIESVPIRRQPNDRTGISRISSDGGTPEVLIAAKPNETFAGPQLLDDADHLLFTVTPDRNQWEKAQVVVQSLSSGRRKILVQSGSDGRYLPTGHLIYMVGKTLFAIALDSKRLITTGSAVAMLEGISHDEHNTGVGHYGFSSTGSMAWIPERPDSRQVMMVTRDGNIDSTTLPKLNGQVLPIFRVSPDGGRVTYGDSSGDVWVYDLSGKRAPRRVTFEGGYFNWSWSPDGLYLALSTGSEISLLKVDSGARSENLVKADPERFPLGLGAPSWSPDGRTLFFRSGQGIWSVSLRERVPKLLFAVQNNQNQALEISPDGRWMAYQDVDVFVQPYPPTGAKYQASVGGGHHPLWSTDGRQLYYVKGVDQLIAVDLQAGSNITLGPPTQLKVMVNQPINSFRTYEITPDGKRFLVVIPSQDVSERIDVVLNWFEELKQRVPVR